MLFNSYVFIFAFAPIAFTGTFALERFGRSIQFAWLIASALIFYGWQEPWFVTILVLSVTMNLADRHSDYRKAKALASLDGGCA